MSDSVHMSVGEIVLGAIVSTFGAVIVGFTSYFGGRGSVQAQLQAQLNASFKDLTDQLQKERVTDHAALGLMRGDLTNLEQHILSLEDILRRAGLPIPPRPKVTTVFFFESQSITPPPLQGNANAISS